MDNQVQSFAVANLRRRPLVLETGGFVLGLDPATTSPHINYATPLPGARPSPADVAGLVAAFRERGLTPRLEFAPEAVPAVAPALAAAGFAVEEEHEVLARPAGPLPRVDGPDPAVERPETDEEFAAIDAALAEAFGGVFASTPEGAERLRRTDAGGGAVRFVRAPDGSGCAGAAMCSAPAEGTAELAGVGTRPTWRGRGIASAVTRALTARMFEAGAESVWLEYSGDASRRVYERLGYRGAGRRLYVTLRAER